MDSLLEDEELIYMLRRGHFEIESEFIRKYSVFSVKIIHNLIKRNGATISYEELYSCFLSTFYKAIETYKSGLIVFKIYFLTLLNRELVRHIKTVFNSKELTGRYLSIDLYNEENDSLLIETLYNEAEKDEIKSYVNVRDTSSKLFLANTDHLNNSSSLTQKILLMRLAGFSYRETARLLSIDLGVVKRVFANADQNGLLHRITLCLK